MAKVVVGKSIGDLAGPDLGAVGNVARASKQDIRQPQELTSFSVKKGDNGGVIVCETYERKAPEGRRAASFLGGGDYKENPFGPDDGGEATTHITGLLSQMGVSTAGEANEKPAAPRPQPIVPPTPPRPPAPPPSIAAARGPSGAGIRVAGGGRVGGMFAGPDALGPRGGY